MRQDAAMPPFHYLAMLRAQSNDQAALLRFLHSVKDDLRAVEIDTLGPAPAPLAKKANQHRMQLLLKSPSRQKLHASLTQLRAGLSHNKLARRVRWSLDVDPMDLS